MPNRRTEIPLMSTSFRLAKLWDEALDWIYPGAPLVCVLCHRVIPVLSERQKKNLASWVAASPKLGEFVCPFCLQEAGGVHVTPMVRWLETGSTLSTPVYSPYRYEGFVQRTIRPWKYDGALGLTEWFSDGMQVVIDAYQIRSKVNVITPVPTSLKRLKERGYHHTLLLANRVGASCGLRVIQTLQRIGATPTSLGNETQTAKSATLRKSSLTGSFLVAKGVNLRGARVLLIDDVVTTGATLQACVEQLYLAGAATVVCLVIADVA